MNINLKHMLSYGAYSWMSVNKDENISFKSKGNFILAYFLTAQ